MGSVNKVIVVGNLGGDPDVKTLEAGRVVANFRVATTERWKDKTGEERERTEWHRIVAWGKTAELVGEYLEKGRQVYVEGRLQTRTWKDTAGVERFSTEVVADVVTFLGRRPERSEDGGSAGYGRGSDRVGIGSGTAGAPPEGAEQRRAAKRVA